MNIEYSDPPRCEDCDNDGVERYFEPQDQEIIGLCKDCYKIRIHELNKECDHQWNFSHPSGFIVCDKCKKIYSEKCIKEQTK